MLFDLDGTVWDSIPFYARLLEDMGGPPAATTCFDLQDGGNIVAAVERWTTRTRFKHACANRADELALYEGARETLQSLQSGGVALGAVTALPAWIAEPLVLGTGLDAVFRVVQTALGKKASGRSIRQALHQLGAHPTPTSYYVGDRDSDMQGARAAGLTSVWASYGYGTRPPGADIEITSFSELLHF